MLQIVKFIEKRFPNTAGVIVKIVITLVGLGLMVGAALLLER